MFSSDLIDFNSPMRQPDINFSATNSSPGNNPFDSVIKMIENAAQKPEFVDSLSVNVEEYFLNCNTGDLLEKESLGILKLEKLSSSFGSDLIFINSECKTARDSVSSSLNRAFLLSSSSRGFPSVSTVSAANGSRNNLGSLDVEPSPCGTFDELPEGDDDVFEDLCYIEARHWASKLSDSNLISDNFFEDTLDSTTPPELVVLEEPEEKIIDTDTVFREIDKVVPALVEDIIEIKTVTGSCDETTTASDPKHLVNNDNSSNNETDRNLDLANNACVPENFVSNPDLLRNEIEIPRDLNNSVTNLASVDNQIKSLCDSKKFINETINSKQNLLYEQKVQKYDYFNYSYEALDLTINKTNNDEALDLSMKSSRNENRRLSRSFTLPSQMKLFNTKKSESISNCIKPISNPKLKSKKIEDKGSKVSKGPLKAVIPVIDMSKRLSGKIVARVTPPKVRTPSLFKIKTSTPINKSQMIPVAQSTPQMTSESRDQSVKKDKFSSPVFRTKRQNSDAGSSNNSSRSSSAFSSTPNLSNLSNQSGNSKRDSFIPTSKPVHRRHYSTGFQPTETKAILARSYSFSPDHNQVLSNKLKQTSFVSKTSAPKVKTKESPQSKQILNERNSGSVIKNFKSLNLLGKVKKNVDGKENLRKN